MSSVKFTPEIKLDIARRWAGMKITAAKHSSALSVAGKLADSWSRYEAVQKLTGVPAWFIACLHERESGADFNTYLGNGEPLSRVTRLVPKGRGPFKSWEDGAVDALRLQGFDKISSIEWSDVAFCLFKAEEYNGFGYRLYHRMTSPYVWAGSDQYSKGKYASDGKFDPDLIDQQLGVATMLQALISILGPAILGQISGTGGPSSTGSSPSQGTGAGVTITKTTTVTNFITAMIGAILAAKGIPDITADALHLMSGLGGIILSISALINHLHVTTASNSNTLNSIGTLLTQVGNSAVQSPPSTVQAAAPGGTESGPVA